MHKGMVEYLTTAEFAARLGITPGRVKQLKAQGVIKADRFGPRTLRFASSELARARKRNKKPGRRKEAGNV